MISTLWFSATTDVAQCDFVTVEFSSDLNIAALSETESSSIRKVVTLPKEYYHVVVFCLLLEYLPDPRLRLRTVHNAYRALKDNGLYFSNWKKTRNSHLQKRFPFLVPSLMIMCICVFFFFSVGLLVVITPDSKHAQKNMSMIQSWRKTLLRLGFDRVRYSKHPHLHCISFRKLCPLSRRLMQMDTMLCAHNLDEVRVFSR